MMRATATAPASRQPRGASKETEAAPLPRACEWIASVIEAERGDYHVPARFSAPHSLHAAAG